MIIGIVNHKGGVAKTVTASSLASVLGKHGKKTCFVDLDPQGNGTSALGIRKYEVPSIIYDLLLNPKLKKQDVEKVIVKTEFENLCVIPSNIRLAAAETNLINAVSRETLLKETLDFIKDDFDYIIIDSPPSLGLLNMNAITASDYLVIPLTADFFAMEGLNDLLSTYDVLKNKLRKDLEIMGFLVTLFDQRVNLQKENLEGIRTALGDKVFGTVIRNNSEIKYAIEKKMPVIYFNEHCNGSVDYLNFTKEVMKYEKK